MSDTSRFDVRLPKELKADLERAANIGGFRTFTDFVIAACKEKAKAIMKDHETVLKSRQDQETFVDLVLNPPPPNEDLKAAFTNYENEINNDALSDG